MHDASQDLFPITDWSIEGRKSYLTKHIVAIEQILSKSLEDLNGPRISSVFGSQDKAVEKILSMFVSDGLEKKELIKRGVPCNMKLFSQLDFWCKYKTGKTIAGAQQISVDETMLGGYGVEESDIEHDVEKLSNCLSLYNRSVAPDMVGYWFMANKKLLDELNGVSGINANVTQGLKGSATKLSKYKADASFRFLCLYLRVDLKVTDFHKYQRKYLTRGKNEPQYVANGIETHTEKHEVRKSVAQVIDFLFRVNSDGSSVVCQKLLRSAGRKSLLDQYEIGSDFAQYEKLKYQLSELKSPGKKEATYAVG